MATSTLVQFLAAGQSVETSNKRQVETFTADGTIAAGAPVMFDLAESDDGDKMLKVVESSADAACIGVALAAASAGDDVQVVLSGFVQALVKGTNNAGNSAIAVGDYICQGDVAGEFYKYTIGADAVPHGICAEGVSSAAAAALVKIVMLKQF